MANSYYQTITKPKLYVSYPLWQYANGALDYTSSGFISNEDMIKMIQLDPSKINNINPNAGENNFMDYRIVPESDNFTPVIDNGLWNFDFFAILGHNFASAGAYPKIEAGDDVPSNMELSMSNVVNYNLNEPPEYDGWSLMNIDDKPTNEHREFKFNIKSQGDVDSWNASSIKIGSIIFGKSFAFPQNADLSETITTDYGVKQKQTISGKTISTANWTKVNNWITEPFGLTDGEYGDNFQRRSGRRSWKISFDSLAPEKVMNQLMMMNSNGWIAQENHTTQADGIKSEYNINNAVDFYTNVVHRTMGGHLPMMLQLDADDPSPQNWAIVRMGSKYSIIQKNPNLYNISLTLTEQV
jgi:hypothetical protein